MSIAGEWAQVVPGDSKRISHKPYNRRAVALCSWDGPKTLRLGSAIGPHQGEGGPGQFPERRTKRSASHYVGGVMDADVDPA